MTDWTRRHFVGVTAASAAAALVRTAAAAPEKAAGGPVTLKVDLTGDGVPLTAREYATLLARLTAANPIEMDEYSRGGAVATLESSFASLLGKEAAVFMPSGTLANHLAVRALAGPRRRVVVQEVSHLFNDSGDCAQELSGLTLLPLAPGKGTFTWDDVQRTIERTASGRVAAGVGAIAIESPVRRLRNEAFDFGEMQRISEKARAQGIGLHLDGARLFVASAYSGRPPADYAALFDTVYVSLWKCFNSGGGAILAGPRSLLAELHHPRRMFGGALWNAWAYAAVARHYASGYLDRLTRAVRVSEDVITALGADPRFAVERVPSGTSWFRLGVRTDKPEAVRGRLAVRGVTVGAPDGDGFWLRVNETLDGVAAEDVVAAFRDAVAYARSVLQGV